ncbi:hypothetical protein H4R19_001893 [Coemansia spiralis]|nr:hypothetical protein H4R19_001893 [Coemansia spiralis]
MPLRNLPDDILALVLAKVPRRHYCDDINCRLSLAAAAVCQRWRRLALPVAYAKVYFWYNSQPVGSYGQRGPATTADSDSPRIKTNIDLVDSQGRINLVRGVRISVYYGSNSLPRLAVAVEQLGQVAAHWKRVNTLWIFSSGIERDDNNDAAVTQTVANGLVGLFPGLRTLWTSSNVNSVAIDRVSAVLAAGCAAQLRTYDGRPVPLPAGCVFSQLECVALARWDGDEPCRQSIDTQRLKRLELHSLPLAYTWDMFVCDDGKDTVFPELTSLSIDYERLGSGTAQSRPRLRFPKLQAASVRCSTGDMLLLHQAVFPAQMPRFEIEAPASLFLSLAEVEMPVVKHLNVMLAGSVVEPEALAAVDRFMRRTQGCQQKRLCIWSAEAQVQAGLITCPDLTSLTVHARVGVDAVLAFVEQLQHLRVLVCRNVATRDMQANIIIAPLDAHERVVPLNASLQSLVLTPNTPFDNEDGIAVAKYLLMRLPSLMLFSADGIPEQPVFDFAQEYSLLYPHLDSATDVFIGSE